MSRIINGIEITLFRPDVKKVLDFIYAPKESQRFRNCRGTPGSKDGFDNLAGLFKLSTVCPRQKLHK